MAGFSIHPGGFFLPRGTTTPSKSLQQQIFPGVDDILLQVETGKLERDLAAQGFLRLLQYLRVVLIQDAVVLRQSQPHMRFLAHPVFSSAEFGAFANEMKPALETPEKPISVAIVEALPEL
ncbi:unnamed protein product, partial [Tilletia caries]